MVATAFVVLVVVVAFGARLIPGWTLVGIVLEMSSLSLWLGLGWGPG